MNRVKTLTSQLCSGAVGSTSPSANTSNTVKSGYRYTLNENGALSKEQQEQYEKEGYFVVRNCISSEAVDRYNARFKHLVENPAERAQSMSVVRDVSLAKAGVGKEQANSEERITKFQDFQDDEGLFDFCREPEVLKYAEAIIGADGCQAMHTMFINKPPDTGKGTSRHPLHQDLHYFPFRPIEKIAAAWCALEKITPANGCLIVVPGSHKTELLKHGYPDWEGGVNKAYHGILGLDPNLPVVELPMEKGDVVFFHPLLWHGSGPNLTTGYRKAISCHYASANCQYISVKGTIQEELEEEVKDIALVKLKKLGMEINRDDLNVEMSDFWNMKSRVVRGDRSIGNLTPGTIPVG